MVLGTVTETLLSHTPCPVAVVVGMHPALFMVSGLEISYGKNEYDLAGGLLGAPVEVIPGPRTGLPIPANAEIAFEGLVHPNDLVDEGPFGEWCGYYVAGKKPETVMRKPNQRSREGEEVREDGPEERAGHPLQKAFARRVRTDGVGGGRQQCGQPEGQDDEHRPAAVAKQGEHGRRNAAWDTM